MQKKTLRIICAVISLVALAFCLWQLLGGLTNWPVAILCSGAASAIALVFMFLYSILGGSKQQHGLYTASLGIYAVAQILYLLHIMVLSTGWTNFPLWDEISTIIIVAIVIVFAFAKNIGQTLSYIFAFIMLIITVANLVITSTQITLFTKIADKLMLGLALDFLDFIFALTILFAIMLKFTDKAERHDGNPDYIEAEE